MKKLIIAAIALLGLTTGVAAIADYHMSVEDKAFVERGGKIKGCDSLRYEGKIICVNSEAK